MGLFDSFKVNCNLELRRRTFFPGNVVEGCFHAQVKSEISIVAVRLKITGKEKVLIRRREGTGDNARTVTYTSTAVVYKQLITLAGQLKCSNNRNKTTVPAGDYHYPFSFVLPTTLPPSFFYQLSDDHAHMQYSIKGYIDIPMGRDAKQKQFFTVLNCVPATQWIQRFPAGNRMSMPITFCCCISKGTVSAGVSLDRTLFAIDRDSVTVVCDIDNSLGQEPVNGIEVVLRNHQTLRASGRTEYNTRNIGSQMIRNQPIPPGGRGQLHGTLMIPRHAVPSITGHHVNSSYELVVSFDIPWATDPEMKFPVRCVQSVDESNYFPAMQWDTPLCGQLANLQEYYYQPPQQTYYQVQMMPSQPPPGCQMYYYQAPNQQAPMPDASWNDAALQMCPPVGYTPPKV
jgi:hypothetical protein